VLLQSALIQACSQTANSDGRSRDEFCRDWAAAACSDETVSACQAQTAAACRLAQQAFCEQTVPDDTFSDARGDACIGAVRAAYADADLTGVELNTVLQLGGPCAGVIKGPVAIGESCTSDRDCDGSAGVSCVRRGGQSRGSCQIPEPVGAGQRCLDPRQVCPDGFYCDGNNCIAAKQPGEVCATTYECAPAGYCTPSSACAARVGVGTTCSVDDDCLSGLCYAIAEQKQCVDRVRLSPAEAICQDLR
jgi:hypothetical protein